MLSKLFKKRTTRNILFISLSNIGDVILTFPVFDALCEAYPQAVFSVVVSKKAQSLFEGNPRVQKVFTLEKSAGVRAKIRWLKSLRKSKFDLVVDLRNSMLPFLTRSRRRTRPSLMGESSGHMREKHLRRLRTVLKEIPLPNQKHALYGTRDDERRANSFLMGVKEYVVVAPGAADQKKCWTEEGFAVLIRFLMKEAGCRVVVVGDRRDGKVAERVLRQVPGGVLNLCGLTSLKELAFILKKARLAVVNDSGVMHLASYMDVPVVALFGPTDPAQYGPWSKKSTVVCSFSGRMLDLEPDKVMSAAARALE